jgi:HAD superfamily hydrolase (TIGR01509 family)
MRKYLLWDHDGVLVDTEKWYFAATQDCLRRLGVELDQPTYLRLMADGRASWELARAQGIAEDIIVAARRDRDACYQQYLAEADIEIEGVIDVLSELRARYRMAIVTTAKREDFALIHRSRKIASFFEFVINVEDCTHAKPHPDPYLRALSRFGASAAEAVAIEDSSRGLKAARAAGLDCIIIRSEFTAAQDFTGAWRIVDSIRDLPSALSV